MKGLRAIALLASCTVVAGCLPVGLAPPDSGPPPARVDATPSPEPVQPSDESLAMRAYFARVQKSLVAQGLLRTDNGGRDAPYTATNLTENFRRVALFEEYANVGGRIVPRQSASTLHRWAEPVTLDLRFAGAVPEGQRLRDRATIEGYAARLQNVIGLPVALTPRDPNFVVYVADEDARRALGPDLRSLIPTISEGAVRTVTDLPRSFYCIVIAYDPDDDGTYTRAVAVIRSELPDLMRRSCFHEEIAQGLGLSNDSPRARPSVFNDDEEFALLTRHDEDLLRILYHPRLQPGMTAEEALPIVRNIAAGLAGGPS